MPLRKANLYAKTEQRDKMMAIVGLTVLTLRKAGGMEDDPFQHSGIISEDI